MELKEVHHVRNSNRRGFRRTAESRDSRSLRGRGRANIVAEAIRSTANSRSAYPDSRRGSIMVHLMPTDVVEEVRAVLARAPDAGRYGRSFLTAYQILERLPAAIRDRLIAERGLGGLGTGTSYAAPSVVAQAAEMLDAEIAAFDSVGVTISVAGQTIVPGAGIVATYRLRVSSSLSAE